MQRLWLLSLLLGASVTNGSDYSSGPDSGLPAGLDELLAGIDTNGDGTVGLVEMAMAYQQLSSQLATEYPELDTDNDGSLSLTEFMALVQEWVLNKAGDFSDRLVEEVDQNGDGRVQPDELMFALVAANEQLQTALAGADQNGDGMVSFGEFVNATAALADGAALEYLLDSAVGESLADVFSEYDLDGDGYLSEEELQALALAASGQLADTFPQLDSDGDGVVSAEELRDAVVSIIGEDGGAGSRAEERFAEADLDGDGYLSGEEYSAAHPGLVWEIGFDVADADGDGQLSLQEYARLLTVLMPLLTAGGDDCDGPGGRPGSSGGGGRPVGGNRPDSGGDRPGGGGGRPGGIGGDLRCGFDDIPEDAVLPPASEILQLNQEFDSADTNNDNRLSYAELQRGWGLSDVETRETANAWDANGDGYISRPEYLEAEILRLVQSSPPPPGGGGGGGYDDDDGEGGGYDDDDDLESGLIADEGTEGQVSTGVLVAVIVSAAVVVAVIIVAACVIVQRSRRRSGQPSTMSLPGGMSYEMGSQATRTDPNKAPPVASV